MNIEIKRYGRFPYTVSMTITTDDDYIETDVADNYGIVSESLINQLRKIADELEQHNAKTTAENISRKKE